MKYYILLLFDTIVKWLKAILLRVLMFVISIGAPNGILVRDEVVAEDFLTDNPQLIEKYGEDYSFILIGGGGGSNKMGFDYLVNGEDIYDISLKKEKGKDWEVEGFLYVSCQYVCDELDFSFTGKRSPDNYYATNGELCINGDTIPIRVYLGSSCLYVEDAELRNQYEEERAKVVIEDTDWEELEKWDAREDACAILVCDVESNFDEFTATVLPEYQNLLGKDLTVLHFRAVE